MSQHDEKASVESEEQEASSNEAEATEEHEDTSDVEEGSEQEESVEQEAAAPVESEEEEQDTTPEQDEDAAEEEVVEEAQEEEPPNPFELLLEKERAQVKLLKGALEAKKSELEAMTTERDDFKTRLLRSAADLENFRKRKEREKDEIKKFGAEKVVSDLLPAIDNLERALEHAEKSEEQSSITDGVKMVHRQLISALEKHAIKGFSAVGEKFDPQLHEAIQQIETTEFETGVVMQEFQKGYFIHERLLRPAMTVVAKNVAPPAPEASEDESTEQEPDVIDMGAAEEQTSSAETTPGE